MRSSCKLNLPGLDKPLLDLSCMHLVMTLRTKSRTIIHIKSQCRILRKSLNVMRVQAALTEKLPGAPVTRDQLTMLELGDNVVTDSAALETFQLQLVPLDEQLRQAAS